MTKMQKCILGIFLTYLPSWGTKALPPWENCILCHNTLALTLGWEYVNNEFQCIYRGWNICYCPKERSSLEFSNISFADETLKMIKIEIQVKERSPWVRYSPYHRCRQWNTGICLPPLKEYFRVANDFWCKLISQNKFYLPRGHWQTPSGARGDPGCLVKDNLNRFDILKNPK